MNGEEPRARRPPESRGHRGTETPAAVGRPPTFRTPRGQFSKRCSVPAVSCSDMRAISSDTSRALCLVVLQSALACSQATSNDSGETNPPTNNPSASEQPETASPDAGQDPGDASSPGTDRDNPSSRDAGTSGQNPGPDAPPGTTTEAFYPDSIRCLPAQNDPRCGPGFNPNTALDETTLASLLRAGHTAWTDEGSVGGPCVSCHSPDAVDLAWIGYSDCDIRRRALDHVSAEQAEAIVQYVHARRQQYGIEKPLHPDKYRPLQPAYEPFGDPADDLEVANVDLQDERDEAFMRHLTEVLELTWATTRIDSLELARRAHQELLTLDLQRLPLGIPFDRFSEDPASSDNECQSSGPGHRGQSIFEWLPAMPMRPREGRAATWYALLNDYADDPSTVNLWRYYDAIDELLECRYEFPVGADSTEYARACEWMRFKYKSVQVLQHMLRHQTLNHPDQLADVRVDDATVSPVDHLDTVIHRSPIWEAADLIRVAPLERRGDPACFSSDAHPCTLLPPAIDQSIHSTPSHQEALIQQNDLFQISWFVMSFLHDPTLTTHSNNFATFVGDYLESVLLPRYDIHHAFIVALMAVRKSAASEWFDTPGFREGTGKVASVRTFSFKQLRNNFSEPASGPRQMVHRRMFANFARMWIYLIEDDLRQTGEIYGRSGTHDGSPSEAGGVLEAVRFMREWIGQLEGSDDEEINELVRSIERLAAAAVERRSQDNFDSTDGLQPNNTWGDYQEPYQ